MAETLLYHNPRCSKSRQALALLQERGVEPQIVEYLKTPPSAEELKRVLRLAGLKPRDVLRKTEGAEAGLSADMPEEALIAGLVAHPAALERPIFVHDGRAVLGRPPENVLKLL
ncbi:MAG TPA: arsenate reductase (glutaredoxin) [Ferrovibrio sp.]|uniref:arsenate reductase (glutaredoxin) n=1 Tax=Ferrovibrio sp. TaxID=1917215 RepID=UPI002ED5D1A5